jgi:hypothetical protein
MSKVKITIDKFGFGNTNINDIDIKHINGISLKSIPGETPDLKISVISSEQIIELENANIKIKNNAALVDVEKYILHLLNDSRIDSATYGKIIELVNKI